MKPCKWYLHTENIPPPFVQPWSVPSAEDDDGLSWRLGTAMNLQQGLGALLLRGCGTHECGTFIALGTALFLLWGTPKAQQHLLLRALPFHPHITVRGTNPRESFTHMEGLGLYSKPWTFCPTRETGNMHRMLPCHLQGESPVKFTVQRDKHQKLWEKLIYYICHTQLQSLQ